MEWYRSCFPALRKENGRSTITGESSPLLPVPPARPREDGGKLEMGNEWTQEEVDSFMGTLKPSVLFEDTDQRGHAAPHLDADSQP